MRQASFILFFLAFSAYPFTMTMKAEGANWDKEKNLLVLKGHVVLNRGYITLKAPIVKLNGKIEDPEKITASGNVIVIDKEQNATITSETIEVFLKEKIAYCKGGVKIDYKNRIISATQATYEKKKNIVELNGSCTMTEGDRYFSSDVMRYFIDKEHIEFEGNVKGHLVIK